jgi:hypothetical protein
LATIHVLQIEAIEVKEILFIILHLVRIINFQSRHASDLNTSKPSQLGSERSGILVTCHDAFHPR